MQISKNKKTTKVTARNTGSASSDSSGKSVDKLILELKRGKDEIVRSKAAAALAYSKSENAVEPLIHALKDTHVYVRHGAAWALGELKSPKAVTALKEALHDDDETTRGKAAEALAKIQGK